MYIAKSDEKFGDCLEELGGKTPDVAPGETPVMEGPSNLILPLPPTMVVPETGDVPWSQIMGLALPVNVIVGVVSIEQNGGTSIPWAVPDLNNFASSKLLAAMITTRQIYKVQTFNNRKTE